MTRTLPGLNSSTGAAAPELNGFFLVRVEKAEYRWHQQKPFVMIRFAVIEPPFRSGQSLSGRIYCSARALWRLGWFLRDFGYDQELLSHEKIDERALVGLRGVVRTSAMRFRGGVYQNLEGFAPVSEWENLPHPTDPGGGSSHDF